jgi:phenylacetate-CoA ligase
MPVVRDFLRARGVDACQSYGTADVGLIAYETPAHEGLVVEEDVIVEIVHPGTGDPVAIGEVGEVVVTSFSAEYPLVRLATGDLSAQLAQPSPCGRTNMRIRGWMGRADQSAKVRGLFVHPHQVAEVLRRHGAARGRLVIENEQGEDRMTFKVAGPVDAKAMEASLRDVMKVRGEVVSVDPSALPDDGRVIEDRRRYS